VRLTFPYLFYSGFSPYSLQVLFSPSKSASLRYQPRPFPEGFFFLSNVCFPEMPFSHLTPYLSPSTRKRGYIGTRGISPFFAVQLTLFPRPVCPSIEGFFLWSFALALVPNPLPVDDGSPHCQFFVDVFPMFPAGCLLRDFATFPLLPLRPTPRSLFPKVSPHNSLHTTFLAVWRYRPASPRFFFRYSYF